MFPTTTCHECSYPVLVESIRLGRRLLRLSQQSHIFRVVAQRHCPRRIVSPVHLRQAERGRGGKANSRLSNRKYDVTSKMGSAATAAANFRNAILDRGPEPGLAGFSAPAGSLVGAGAGAGVGAAVPAGLLVACFGGAGAALLLAVAGLAGRAAPAAAAGEAAGPVAAASALSFFLLLLLLLLAAARALARTSALGPGRTGVLQSFFSGGGGGCLAVLAATVFVFRRGLAAATAVVVLVLSFIFSAVSAGGSAEDAAVVFLGRPRGLGAAGAGVVDA